MNILADLFFQIAMIIFLFYSYVYAMTKWGISKRRKNTMKEPEPANLIPKRIFIINSILKTLKLSDRLRQKGTNF